VADRQAWRATDLDNIVLAAVRGNMVHKAIRRWMFPGNPHLESFLEICAVDAGLVSEAQRKDVIGEAIILLDRLQRHPLWEKINNALERNHEVPYTYQHNNRTETGFIDLLYKDQKGWHIVDFKTDNIASSAYRAELVAKYTAQARRYHRAVKTLLDIEADTSICFLDDHSGINMVDIQTLSG